MNATLGGMRLPRLAGALAVACTPSGSGATTAPSGSVAPAGSVAPPSDGTGKGGYGY